MGSSPTSGVMASVLKRLKNLGQKPRASERSPRDTSVYLFSDSAFIGQANLIDESQGGAKVSSPTPDALKNARYLLNPNTAIVYTVDLAWSSGREAGFQYVTQRRLRGYIDDPKLEIVQTFWNNVVDLSAGGPKAGFGRAR
jgi:hypothetical protein